MKDEKLLDYLDNKFTRIETKISGVENQVTNLKGHTKFQYWLLIIVAVIGGITLAFFESRLDSISERVDSIYYLFKPYEAPKVNINNSYNPNNSNSSNTNTKTTVTSHKKDCKGVVCK